MTNRIVRGVATTLTLTVLDQSDNPANAAGTMTIGVADAAGTAIVAAGTATANPGIGKYTYALAAQAALGVLTATWTNGALTWTTTHEVVSSRYYTTSDAQASHDELADGGDFNDADIIAKRDAVEAEIERITRMSFCRRRTRLSVDGTGTPLLELPVRYVRRVVSATILASYGSASSTALTAGQLGAVALDDADPPDSCTGIIVRTDGATWPSGRRRIVVDVEHGFDDPPPDLRVAAMRLAYWRHHERNTEVLDRALSFGASGGSYQLAQPSEYSTGIPVVDAVLSRYSRRARNGEPVVASRPMRLNVGRHSIFHQ